MKKTGGIQSGPPAESVFNLLIIRFTKNGEKLILEIPGSVVQGRVHGNLRLSVVNWDWKYLDSK